MKTSSKILRERRIELGLTQDQVAAEAGIQLQYYQLFEYGRRSLATCNMKVGLLICATLKLDPYEIAFQEKL